MVAPKRKPAQPAEPQFSEQAEVVEQETSNLNAEEQAQVDAALARDTQNGPGDDPVPPSDFESFATEGVEKERKSLQTITQEVLTGHWGDFRVRRKRLRDAGYDPTEVQTLVNMRVAGGAPSSHKPSALELAAQLNRREWGSTEEEAMKNLRRAGYDLNQLDVEGLWD